MRENKIAILLIGIASLVCLLLAGGTFGLWTLIVGVILLVMLFAFGGKSYETRGERVVFCLIGAICVMLAVGLITPIISELVGTSRFVVFSRIIDPGSPVSWQILFGIVAYIICWRASRDRGVSVSRPRIENLQSVRRSTRDE